MVDRIDRYTRLMRFTSRNGGPGNWSAEHARVCDRQWSERGAFPPKYVFAGEADLDPPTRANADAWIRRTQQYRASVAEYYEYADHIERSASPEPGGEAHEHLLSRLAALFLSRLLDRRTLVLGLLGTSVAAGQDNCHYYTLAPLQGRELARLLNGTGVRVEARNFGQNGDGPNAAADLLIGSRALGADLQLAHRWFDFIDEPPAHVEEWWWRDMARRGVVVHTWNPPRGGADAWVWGAGGWASSSPGEAYLGAGGFERALNWFPQHFWGRTGDGRCHVRTREGAYGVTMQSAFGRPTSARSRRRPPTDAHARAAATDAGLGADWHSGPLRFQMLVDGTTLVYAKALERAFAALRDGKRPADLEFPRTAPAAAQPACASQDSMFRCENGALERARVALGTGMGPRFAPHTDLAAAWVLPRDTPPTPPLTDDGEGAALSWTYAQSKRPSTIGAAAERVADNYAARPECSAFGDATFVYRVSDGAPGEGWTPWLRFKLPAPALEDLRDAAGAGFSVFVCAGHRDGAWKLKDAAGWTLHLGVAGSPTAAAVALDAGPATSAGCVRIGADLSRADVSGVMGLRLHRAAGSHEFAATGFAVHSVVVVGYAAPSGL